MNKWILIVALALFVCADAMAETLVSTDTLRLGFDDSGRMQSAIACFPACSGENPRIQQFGDAAVIGFGDAGSGRWEKTENRTEEHYVLEFRNKSGASLTWRIPVHGYRVELEHYGVRQVTIHSGESFRPRESAGFGNWLEQSRYAVLHAGDARQIGLDDSDTTEAAVDQWVGYRNRYWTLMAAPPGEVNARLHTAENNEDARREDLKVIEVRVDEGPTMKRAKSRSRGSRSPIMKRTSHFTVVVGTEEEG